MKSALSKWGQRAMGQAPTVSPRTRSRFEPEAPQADTGEPAITEIETETTVSPRHDAAPKQPISETPNFSKRPDQALAQTPSAPVDTKRPNRDNAAQPPAKESPQVQQPLSSIPSETMPKNADTERSNAISPIPQTSSQLIQSQEPTPAPANQPQAYPAQQDEQPHQDASNESSATPRPLERELQRLLDWMSEPAEAPEKKATQPPETTQTRSIAQPDLPMQQAAPVAPFPQAAPPPPQPAPVEVNIGAIIVRASQPAPPAPKAPQPQTSNLAAYLARRAAGKF